MPFPSSPVAGVTTYTTPAGVNYIYNAKGAWALVGGGGGASAITQATETALGGGQIITQAEANAATAASGNDTDILTMKKLLNLGDPGKANLKTTLGMGGVSRFYNATAFTTGNSNSGTFGEYTCGAYGNGLYVVGGTNSSSNTRQVARSTDLYNWSVTTVGTAVAFASFDCMAFGASVFVAGDSLGGIYSSTDAITWTSRVTGGGAFRSIVYGGSSFVAVSSGGVRRSTDGITWTLTDSGTTFNAVTWGNGVFVAVGNSGLIKTSPDGVTWTTRASGTTFTFPSVAYGSGRFVALAGTTSNRLFITSVDGISWAVSSDISGGSVTGGGIVWTGDCFGAFPFETSTGCGANAYWFGFSHDGRSWYNAYAPFIGYGYSANKSFSDGVYTYFLGVNSGRVFSLLLRV